MALAKAGINEATPEIEGGVIARYPGTQEPTGYLEETAIMALGALNASGDENLEDLLVQVQEVYTSNGITTVQDGGTSGAGLAAMRKAGAAGRLKVDIVAYPSPLESMCPEGLDNVMAENQEIVGTYINHVKIGGYKILLDGSPRANRLG